MHKVEQQNSKSTHDMVILENSVTRMKQEKEECQALNSSKDKEIERLKLNMENLKSNFERQLESMKKERQTYNETVNMLKSKNDELT